MTRLYDRLIESFDDDSFLTRCDRAARVITVTLLVGFPPYLLWEWIR